MAGEHDGGKEAQEQGQAQGGQGGQQEAQGATTGQAGGESGADTSTSGSDAAAGGGAGGVDYAAQIAERDRKIAELTAQVTAAAANAEAAEKLSREIAEVRAQAESDRVEYQLTLAGARNVKAARAFLDDHGGDVEKLKASESWLFGAAASKPDGAGSGSTGLPNAGAAKDSERQLRHFYEVAGVVDDKE